MDLSKYFSQTLFLVDHYVSIKDYEMAFYSLINALSKIDVDYMIKFTSYFKERRNSESKTVDLPIATSVINDILLNVENKININNLLNNNENSSTELSKIEKKRLKDKNKKKRNKANKAAKLKNSLIDNPVIAEDKNVNVKNIIEAIESKISSLNISN